MANDVGAEQVAYYRRRAAEYDETAYGDLDRAQERIARIVDALRPRGRVLEVACGTGLWTRALASQADSVTAIDAAPEAVSIARERVPAPHVDFEVADAYTWTTDKQFDAIFFAAWLSHVPTSRFEQFWQVLLPLLADDGRVCFVDEHVDERAKEAFVHDEVVERRLRDGSTFRIVKRFVDPRQMGALLRRIGWDCRIIRDGNDWVVGEAWPATRRLSAST